jgi:hypothetical protein
MHSILDVDIHIINECLDMIHTDLNMLDEGEWTPDSDSIQAAQNNVARIAQILQIDLQDTRAGFWSE